jgi:hypothetical protein
LKRLGAHIVFADLSRIIVCTNKFNIEDALSYMNYLLTNLQNRDLFNTIHIDTNKVWTVLLWNDSANYGGIRVNLEDENKEEIDMNWKICSFLPDIKALVAGYLGSVSEALKDFQAKAANKSSQTEVFKDLNQYLVNLINIRTIYRQRKIKIIVTYSQELVSGELTEQLMRYKNKAKIKLKNIKINLNFFKNYTKNIQKINR